MQEEMLKYWMDTNSSYAQRYLTAPEGMVIDHINGNGLDNRKINLRICTYSQNNLNRIHNPIIHKGVTFRKDKNKYQAKITTRNKTTHIGYFNSVEDAGNAYLNYLKEY